MLAILKKQDFDKYADRFYNLSLDITRSSYPTYTDGIKTKKDFIAVAYESFKDANREILLYSDGNEISGWINYYIIPEDKYIGLDAFITERNTGVALNEFEKYCKSRYSGYTLYLGFSSENTEAISYFKDNGYRLLEASYPHVFHLNNFKPLKCSDKIIKIGKENYRLFEALHENADNDMYWNSERIFQNIDKWQIYYLDDGKSKGSIYFTGKAVQEIFGIDFSDNKFNLLIFSELISKCLNVCHSIGAEHLYYFSEKNESNTLLNLGFKSLGGYECYTLCLT